MEDKDLIFTRRDSISTREAVSDFTKEMDEHLLEGWKDNGFGACSYLCTDARIHRNKKTYALRFPGATRGHIQVSSDNIIEEIVFYEDTCYGVVACYQKSLEDIKEKYIGMKIVFSFQEG